MYYFGYSFRFIGFTDYPCDTIDAIWLDEILLILHACFNNTIHKPVLYTTTQSENWILFVFKWRLTWLNEKSIVSYANHYFQSFLFTKLTIKITNLGLYFFNVSKLSKIQDKWHTLNYCCYENNKTAQPAH